MKTYEYRLIRPSQLDEAGIETEINKLGKKGYRVIAFGPEMSRTAQSGRSSVASQMSAMKAPAWYILMEREETPTGIGAR